MKNWVLPVTVMLAFVFAQGQEASRVPEKPTDLKVSRRFDGATAVAILRWQDQSENELGFEVVRSDGGKEFRVLGISGANTVRYEDEVGKYVTGPFTYKIRAFNQAGRSENSNSASVWF